MPYQVEHTDTFGGEANYSWVHRHTLTIPDFIVENPAKSRRWLVRQAKALSGLTGIRCNTSDMGDLIEIRPKGLWQIVFITWEDSDNA